MTKVSTAIFFVMWVLTLPIVVIGIGFAGNNLWSPSAIYNEVIAVQWEGLVIRLGLLFYAYSPVLVYRSYRRNLR